jgi:serralysin
MTARIHEGAEMEGFIARAATGNVGKSGNRLADGVLSGYEWKGTTLTYAFPDAPSDYGYGPEKARNFKEITAEQQAVATRILDKDDGIAANDGFSLEGLTNLDVGLGTDSGAMIRYAGSNAANPTAYAYYPTSGARGGDVWFGSNNIYDKPVAGNYAYATLLHETGHALGLKHGHEAVKFDKIKTELAGKFDSLEYSVMTYHSFAGQTGGAGYTNEKFGFPQSYMMADIYALQHMYGADYDTNSTGTVYSWTPESGDTLVNGAVGIDTGDAARHNRIFATIWDGGGIDEYDLSAYSTRVVIDLRPGEHSVFSKKQLADLNDWGKGQDASGNIYNAMLFDKNTASLIENATGGTGNDRLAGNNGSNVLDGNSGNDTLKGFKGTDTYHGGLGEDTFIFGRRYGADIIDDFANGEDRINLSDFNLKNYASLEAKMSQDGGNVVINLGHGDTLTLLAATLVELDKTDFIL